MVATHEDQIPSEFEFYQRIYRCTHGVSQASRSKGHRNRKTRYCKCKARLTAAVNRCADNTFKIMVRNENHTHSHPTTGTEASFYLTTKTLPLDDEDREDVKTLADARVSSTHITNFLNDRLGCKVTPHQTRNLLRSIAGQDSGKDHMKNILHALRQLDGSDVLVIQDQFDVTCGVVMQTKVQKMMSERWGETVAMDFTHGTNNLGYHLATLPTIATLLNTSFFCLVVKSLVVTTCTGRGFPVVDFICLNEQATTISTILEYFKEKNPLWENVVSVVIDKDFTEWKVLEECFPKAKILLCQYHAISYWKKVTKRSIYGIKAAQGEKLLGLMIKLLYSSTQDAYDTHCRNLKGFCHRNKKHAFFAYFDKNWNSCNEIWSNFARGKYFTAGNTTTNRIESNWNQLKMLLGLKTRIDQTIAGLLQHQMTIIQQIVSEIGQLHSSSRRPQTAPTFLREVGSRISAHVLEKLKREWEQFVSLMEETMSEAVSLSTWMVSCHNHSFECDDLDWKCTCLFSMNNHLPCRHLMHLARKGYGFKMLPVMTIRERWSTLAALNSIEKLTAAGDMLRSIVRMSMLRLPKVMLPDASTPTPPLKQVVYVRLRRRERANQVVLSSAEKYSFTKAMVEPLSEHLSRLGSAEFYEEFQTWKSTIEEGIRVGESRAKQRKYHGDDDDDELDQRVASTIEPADAIATAKLMETLENQINEDFTDGMTFLPPNWLLPVLNNPRHRSISCDRFPKGKRRNQSRSTPTHLRQSKITSARLAIHKYPTGLTAKLDELIIWARNTPNVKHVLTTMEKYPVQLTDAYLRLLVIDCQWEAIQWRLQLLLNERNSANPPSSSPVYHSKELFLTLLQPSTQKYGSCAEFYRVKAKAKSWFEGRKWLEHNWSKLDSDGVTRENVRKRHQSLANEVISKFTNCRLRSAFATRCDKVTIPFEELVGSVCRGWLSDSSTEFCLGVIAAFAGVVAWCLRFYGKLVGQQLHGTNLATISSSCI
ncbi:Zinc finger SWIM domain-containing protein 3 [Phytophthora citrophthora]|uniref:Zinc finger SWIM domain-containing protein 3 n=1 Tax=Phytophthora citrophthora TaxID=4793 RepID=A0AAD9GZJ7_9STRA|nr:Zinc finger SWIM domain-containing protein 3 [Phytophthora citrophthora]